MRDAIVAVTLGLACAPALAQEAGMITRPSRHSVAETTARLESAIVASGTYKVFYRLDHAENAQKEAGARLPPSQLILFGNPKGGAPLIKESPTLALDLPNRALVWEDASGKVWITYNDIASVFARHGLKRTEDQVKAVEARQKALFDKAGD
jgi:uncharacterized protein (DUF302 family)